MKVAINIYTEEELNEMIAFFQDRKLPQTMQINKSAKTENLPFTVECCIEQAKLSLGNKNMQGAFLHLKQIRAILEKEDEPHG